MIDSRHYIPQKNDIAIPASGDKAGNRCGHTFLSPRVFQEPKRHKKRPYLIVEARRRLRSTYYNPAMYEAGMMAFHTKIRNLDGGMRKMRSELREAVTHQVGEALTHIISVSDMAAGFTDAKADKFIRIGITRLAKLAGVSYQRTREALRVFEQAGTVVLEQETFLTKDGQFRKGEALIRVTKQFFYNLGFDDMDIKNFKQKEKAQKERTEKEQGRLKFRENSDLYIKIKRGQRLSERELRLLDKNDRGWRKPYQQRPVIAEFKATVETPTLITRNEANTETWKAIRSKLNTT